MRTSSAWNSKNNNKGSITIEAAIALPIYIFAIIILVSIIEMLRGYQDVETDLHRAGRELAVYEGVGDCLGIIDDEDINSAAAKILEDGYASSIVISNLNNNNQAVDYIENGTAGICFMGNLLSDNKDDDIIELTATYKLSPKVNFFGLAGISTSNQLRAHIWNGYELETNEDENEERMVYITQTGRVYHLTSTCTHINLSIMPIEYDLVSEATNEYGSHYRRCDICGGGSSGTVFITRDGDCYHASLTCSGLKRMVEEIPISQVGDRPCCQRCVENAK